ncbi:MAG TPA: family 78 glycoside hydrolase catalytic domain [Myxococcaceae bacterium]|nr:family 78 glycoside hydrolase catalytic domain [Myxococcaceae bacterium]
MALAQQPMTTRRADWIWRQRPPLPPPLITLVTYRRPEEERNRFVYFRKTLTLPARPTGSAFHVSADGRYQLWVNGQRVGRGPSRCDPAEQSYDTYELTPYLREGPNLIAVLAHTYGRAMSWYQPPRYEHAALLGLGGLFVQGDIHLADGSTARVDTDASWRYLEGDAWERQTPVGGVGFSEVYDASREPVGWQSNLALDESGWGPAAVLREVNDPYAPPIIPFPRMVPRQIAQLVEGWRVPARLHRIAEVVESAESRSLAARLADEPLRPLEQCQVSGPPQAQAELVVRTAPGRAVALVWDFGEIVPGRPCFELTAAAGTIIDVAYSERVKDDRVETHEAAFDFFAQNVDRFIAREGRQQWERFEWTGARYLQLTVRQASGPVTLHTVGLNTVAYPVEPRGAFTCSDPLLQRIWTAGQATLHRCMSDGYMDCPQREQRQFVGDAYVSALLNSVTFANHELTAQLLRQVAQSQRPDGMTHMATTADTAEGQLGPISDYCLYWMMSVREYVRDTGDVALAEELFPAVEKALGWFIKRLDSDGLLSDVPHWIFVDWATVDRRGQSTVLNAQFHHTLETSAELAELTGAHRQAHAWRQLADRVKAALNTLLWDEARGVYVDSRLGGSRGRRVSQHSNAMCVAYGLAPRERWTRILDYVMDPQRVKLTSTGMFLMMLQGVPPFDEERDVALAQPFFMHHVHRALVKAGRFEQLLANIRERWGVMVERGPTLWELWQPIGSECHAWAGTPTYDLSRELLGVTPLKDGFSQVRIAPRLVDLEWLRGRYPTPRGELEVSLERRQGQLHLEVKAPPSVTVELVPPEGTTSVTLNGQPVR